MADLKVKQLGKYKLEKLLGQGGMGAVYKAYQPGLEREVAIKTIHGHLVSDPKAIERFQREAKIVAALRHPSIVQVHDFDIEDGTFYMVMEFVPGRTLESYLAEIHDKGERLPLTETLRLFRQICRAVAFAHTQDIAHQDLKPANVLLTDQEQPILADFGLSRIIGAEHEDAPGTVSGTPQYMSPEQCSGEVGDARSDVYSLGIMLYELVTGTLPFTGKTAVGLILKHISEPAPSARAIVPNLPVAIEEVIDKCLEKEADKRYASAQELLDAIDTIVAPVAALEMDEDIPLDERCPYRGLQAFEEEHAEFYFGREALVDRLVNKVKQALDPAAGQTSRFLAVLGASGSGKSSLVRAGLIPALRQNSETNSANWIITVMKPGNHPLDELTNQLSIVLAGEERQEAKEKLRNHLAIDGRTLHMVTRAAWWQAPPQQRLLLLVDQFEELFTLCHDEAERRSFVENILYAAAVSNGRVMVVLTMRADFYHRCAAYPELASRISDQQLLVGAMEEAELRRAIEQPALHVGLHFEPSLVDTIMADIAQQPGALPLLQHALLELWEGRYGRLLLLRTYQASGGVAGAIAQRADNTYADFNPDEQAIVRQVMLRLTQPGEGAEDTRRRASKRELLSGAAGQAEAVDMVLQQLADARLITITRDTASDEEYVDVAHEALIRGWTRLREWLDQDREALRTHRRLTEAAGEWERNSRDASYLYRGARLAEAEEWSATHAIDLNQLEQEFVQASLTQRDKELLEAEAQRQRELEQAQALAETQRQRAEEQSRAASRLRRFAIALAAIFLVAVVAAIFALIQRSRALANEQLAQEQAEAALEAQQVAEVRRTEAKTAQTQAEEARQTAETRRQEAVAAQTQAEQAARTARAGQLAVQSQAAALESYPLRSLLLAAEAVQINLQAGEPPAPAAEEALRQNLATSGGYSLIGQDDLLTAIAFGPNNRWLATAGGTTARLWQVSQDATATPINLPGHSANITVLAASSTNDELDWLVSGDESGLIRLWSVAALSSDTTNGTESLPLPGHTGPVTVIAASPDTLTGTSNRWLVTGSADNTLRLWDISTLDPNRALSTADLSTVSATVLTEHQASLTAVAVSADGRYLISGDSSGQVYLWDMTALLDPDNLTPFEGDLTTLLDPNAPPINTFTLQGEETTPVALSGHQAAITAIEVSPSGGWLATGSDDATVRLWDLSDPTAAPLILNNESFVTDIAASGDARWLAVGSWDNAARLWDLPALLQIEATPGNPIDAPVALRGHTNPVLKVAISPNNRWLVTASSDHTARRWDLTAPDPAASSIVLAGHEAEVVALSIDPQNQLVSGSSDGVVRLWDLTVPAPSTTDPVLATIPPDASMTTMAVTEDGLLVAGDSDGLVRVWDATLSSHVEFSGPAAAVTTLETGPAQNGQHWLAAGYSEGSVRLWEVAALSDAGIELPSHQAGVTAIAFGSDWLATSSDDATIYLWDLATIAEGGTAPIVLTGHEGAITALAASADTPWLVSGSSDNTVRLWDVRELLTASAPTPEPTSILLRHHEGPITALAVSPDGHWLVSGSSDNTARLWDVDAVFKGRSKAVTAPIILEGHGDRIFALAISPDNRWLATTSGDNSARLWDLVAITGTAAAGDSATTPFVLQGHERPVLAATFSPDGLTNPGDHLLVTSSGDRTARLWHIQQALEQVPAPVVLRGHDRPIFAVAFDPTSASTASRLVTASNDNTIRLWTLPPDTLLTLACATAGRNLTQAEWAQFFSEQAYSKTCPGLPAHYSAIAALLEQAQSAAQGGDAETAATDYAQAATWAVESGDAYLNNLICWHGSLDGSAQVVLPTCEQAVQLTPADGVLRDTRGLARALTGDYAGAIEDFTYFVRWSQENGLYEPYGRRRETWITELEAGRNPFDTAVLESLRTE